LVVDIDPSSCEATKYFKKLTFTLDVNNNNNSPSSATSSSSFTNVQRFSFSDVNMPSTCNFTVYLHTPCTHECTTTDSPDSPLGFNVAINDTTMRGSVDELTNLNELRQLEVQSFDSFNYFINRRTGRTLIQRESLSLSLSLSSP
jgi:hypothetical protein